MVSARGEGAVPVVRRGGNSAQMRLTPYERARKPHQLRTGVDTRSVCIEWIANELTCTLCRKTIQNAMVIRNCMHRFCADCILPKIHTGAKKCPLCKKMLPKKTPLKSDANLDAVISKFSMTPERRCLKRSLSESNHLCFAKRRVLYSEKKTPTKSEGKWSAQQQQQCVKNEMEMKQSCSDMKHSSVLQDCDSEASEPSLVIDEGSAHDDLMSFSQPSSSNASASLSAGDAVSKKCQNKAVMVQRGGLVKYAAQPGAGLVVLGTGIGVSDETSKRLAHCDTSQPIILLHNSSPSGRLNGLDGSKMGSAGSNASRMGFSSTGERPTTKYVPIQPHPGTTVSSGTMPALGSLSTAISTSCTDFSMMSAAQNARSTAWSQMKSGKAHMPTTSQPTQHLSGSGTETHWSETGGATATAVVSTTEHNVEQTQSTSWSRPAAGDNKTSQQCSPSGAAGIASPPEYLFLPPKQRISSGIDAELILYPDASVTLDKKLPEAAKKPRFVVTYAGATVGHLCEYVMQRIAVESDSARLKKRRVTMCATKSDLGVEDVLVVSETGEGQFTTLNVRGESCDPHSSSMFTISQPFVALDDMLTIDKLRREYWSNKKRPMRLVFKFVCMPNSSNR